MSATFTPGPWFVGEMNDCLFVIDQQPSFSFRDVPPHMKENGPNVIAKLDYPAADANARLLAAAPDLLALAYAVREASELGGATINGPLSRMARAALSKAGA